jgi:mannose-6-phosphate isomerase-like protein (cupin superfamily)
MNAWMRSDRTRWTLVCCVGWMAASVLAAQTEGSANKQVSPRQPPKIFYAPKPIQPMPYQSPMKPLVRLADLKAKHKGHADWSELVVYDKNNRAEVISAAPGSKVPRHLHSDAPEYWVVQEGRIRFEIEDPPGNFQSFDAAPGDLVLAPERHLHSLEVIGSEPAIRFQVTLPDTTTIYETKPEQAEKGMEYTPVTLSTGNNPDEVPSDGKPDRVFFNIDALQKEHSGRRSWSDLAVRKNRAHANIICGNGSDVKHTPGDLGHYHTDFAEIWIIMRGQQSYAIEGLDPFVAAAGDIVYAPAKRWHLPEPSGEGMSCRLAMTPYPAGNHLYQPRPQRNGGSN